MGKLVQRGCEEEAAARIVAALTAEGLVSDERFIEALLHVRRVRGYGPLYIRRELEFGHAVEAGYLLACCAYADSNVVIEG